MHRILATVKQLVFGPSAHDVLELQEAFLKFKESESQCNKKVHDPADHIVREIQGARLALTGPAPQPNKICLIQRPTKCMESKRPF